MATGGAAPPPKPPGAPRFRIPVHVLVYSIMLTPVAGYYAYYRRHRKSDEELEEELATNDVYRKQIRDSQSKRQDMVQFLDNIKRGDASPYPGRAAAGDDDGAPRGGRQQRMMDEMLRAGKSEGAKKRMYAVDESLYGTEEGARLAREAREEQEREKQEREKERRRKLKQKKKKKKKTEEGQLSEMKGSANREKAESSSEITTGLVGAGSGKAPQLAVAAIAGTVVVAAIGFVVGGRRR